MYCIKTFRQYSVTSKCLKHPVLHWVRDCVSVWSRILFVCVCVYVFAAWISCRSWSRRLAWAHCLLISIPICLSPTVTQSYPLPPTTRAHSLTTCPRTRAHTHTNTRYCQRVAQHPPGTIPHSVMSQSSGPCQTVWTTLPRMGSFVERASLQLSLILETAGRYGQIFKVNTKLG